MASIKSTETVPVRCPRHPENRQALSFCFECRAAFCFACRVRPETSHAGHRAELLESAFATCAAQHRLAHATLDEAARADKVGRAARDADRAALDDRLHEALRLVDSTCDGLHRLVQNMRATANAILFAGAERADRRAGWNRRDPSDPTVKAIILLLKLVILTENQAELEILLSYSSVQDAVEAVDLSEIPEAKAVDVA